nr:unnamed protein product [Callosobruchus chinensis]
MKYLPWHISLCTAYYMNTLDSISHYPLHSQVLKH